MATIPTKAPKTSISAIVNQPSAASTAPQKIRAPTKAPQGAQLGSVPPPPFSEKIERSGALARPLSGGGVIYFTSERPMIQRARKLVARVITKRTSPVAISRLIARPLDSGKLRAMLAAIVEGFAWLIRLKLTPPETERMIATAIVSPSARPRPSIAPEITEERPNGSTVVRIISQRVAPRACAPSCRLRGGCEKTSRATAEAIGRVITER